MEADEYLTVQEQKNKNIKQALSTLSRSSCLQMPGLRAGSWPWLPDPRGWLRPGLPCGGVGSPPVSLPAAGVGTVVLERDSEGPVTLTHPARPIKKLISPSLLGVSSVLNCLEAKTETGE